MTRADMHLTPAHFYLRITSPEKVLIMRRDPVFLFVTESPESPENLQIIRRAESVLSDYLDLSTKYQCPTVRVTISPALTSSAILPTIRLSIKNIPGAQVEVLTPLAEIERCLRNRSSLFPESLVIFLAEQSLQFAFVQNGKLMWLMSLNCGPALLNQRFLRHDPPETAELIALRQYVTSELDRLTWNHLPPTIEFVSDVTCALARVCSWLVSPDNSFTLRQIELKTALPTLLIQYQKSFIAQLADESDYARMLIPTAILCEHLLDYLGLERIAVRPCAPLG